MTNDKSAKALPSRGSGRSALDKIVATPGGSLDTLWHSMVDGIVSIARDPNFDASRDMKSNRFTALDQFMFTESDDKYKSRFSKFVALLNKLGRIVRSRGGSDTRCPPFDALSRRRNNASDAPATFSCKTETITPGEQLRRLTSKQYRNTLRDLFHYALNALATPS